MTRTITAVSIAAACALVGLDAQATTSSQQPGSGGQGSAQTVTMTGCVQRETGTGGTTAMYRLTEVERVITNSAGVAPPRSESGVTGASTSGIGSSATGTGASSAGSGGATSTSGSAGAAGSAGNATAGPQSSKTAQATAAGAHGTDEYRLVAASSVDLSAHVNHKVQVSGTIANVGGPASGTRASTVTPELHVAGQGTTGSMASGSTGAGTTGAGTVGASTTGSEPGGASGARGAGSSPTNSQAGATPTFMVSAVRLVASTCN
ncbi:MAG: hypothetical protein ABI051_14825 [Vicinamibacterales bacterium]